MKLILAIAILFCSVQTFYSQEDGVVSLALPIRNSLTYNQYTINPTFSFVRQQNKYISISNKREWVQFEDAPQTYLAGYTGRFAENIGAGVGLFQQNYGVLTTFGGILNFAYNAQLQRDNNLTFGMNVGVYKSGINTGNVVANYPDPSLDNVPSNLMLTVTPGINYGTAFVDFGISVKNAVLYNINSSELISEGPQQSIQGHIMYTGYMYGNGFFDESKFTALVRSEFGKETTIISGAAMVTVPKGIWAQAGYNSLYGISGGLGLNITPQLSIEYNFEKSMGDLTEFGPSHEITLAYKFKNRETYDYSREDQVGSILSFDKRKKPATKTASANRPKATAVDADTRPVAQTEELPEADEVLTNVQNEEEIAKAEEEELARIAAEEKAIQEAEERERLVAETKAKEEAEARAKAEEERIAAEQLAKDVAEAKAKLAEESRIKAEAEERAQKAAEAKAKAEAEAEAKEQARIAAEEKAKQEVAEKERLEAEAKAKAEAEEQARIAAEEKATQEAAEKERLEAEAKTKAEAEEQARIAAEENAKQEAAEKERLAAEAKAFEEAQAVAAQKAKDSLMANPDDELGKSMRALAELAAKNQNAQKELLSRFTDAVEVKDKDLKELKEENDLGEQGIITEPKPFKSVTAENEAIERIKLNIDGAIEDYIIQIQQLDTLYIQRTKKIKDKNDPTNRYFEDAIAKLKVEQSKLVRQRANLSTRLEDINLATEFERKRRIKRALYDNEEDRYVQDRAALRIIKQNTQLSTEPLAESDFDFGEEQSNSIQILKNVKNVESGYYLVVAVHEDVAKRDDFVRKAVSSGQSNIDFFYDVATSKYFIYYSKFENIGQANEALQNKGNAPYNAKMAIIKIEN